MGTQHDEKTIPVEGHINLLCTLIWPPINLESADESDSLVNGDVCRSGLCNDAIVITYLIFHHCSASLYSD